MTQPPKLLSNYHVLLAPNLRRDCRAKLPVTTVDSRTHDHLWRPKNTWGFTVVHGSIEWHYVRSLAVAIGYENDAQHLIRIVVPSSSSVGMKCAAVANIILHYSGLQVVRGGSLSQPLCDIFPPRYCLSSAWISANFTSSQYMPEEPNLHHSCARHGINGLGSGNKGLMDHGWIISDGAMIPYIKEN